MFFDNNCTVMKHLKAVERDGNSLETIRLLKMKLPVDVFHHKSKHRESDVFCGTHCNPAMFPELHTSDGKWTFNSSIAEQTNVWFGGFLAIVREMRVDRYNFFLDEVIRRRNNCISNELERRGTAPWQIPRDILLDL